MKYTENKENELYGFMQPDDEEANYADVLSFLNEDFRSFGEGILALAEKKEGKHIDDPLAYLRQKCKETGIDFDCLGKGATVPNWFLQDKRPKKSETSRQKMFVLAFILGLSVEETRYLFQQVYLDRAFNQRDYREVIYYYCLSNHLSLQKAEILIKRVSIDEAEKADKVIYTSLLEEEIAGLQDVDEIINFIESHARNFMVATRSAKREMLIRKEEALAYAQAEAKVYWDQSIYGDRDRKSDGFLYFVITGQDVTGGDKNGSKYCSQNGIRTNGTRTVSFKNAAIPDEIKNNFPQVKSLSEKVKSTEEIRKTLIMLFSFIFWSQAKDSEIMIGDLYDRYLEEINLTLKRAGLPMMYYGNPFDWLFLYCTYQKEARDEEPLTVFRDVLTEILAPEQK